MSNAPQQHRPWLGTPDVVQQWPHAPMKDAVPAPIPRVSHFKDLKTVHYVISGYIFFYKEKQKRVKPHPNLALFISSAKKQNKTFHPVGVADFNEYDWWLMVGSGPLSDRLDSNPNSATSQLWDFSQDS